MKFALFVLVISAASLGPTFVKKQIHLCNDTGITYQCIVNQKLIRKFKFL